MQTFVFSADFFMTAETEKEARAMLLDYLAGLLASEDSSVFDLIEANDPENIW